MGLTNPKFKPEFSLLRIRLEKTRNFTYNTVMTIIDTHTATPEKLSDALRRIKAGEEVFITGDDDSVYKIMPVDTPVPTQTTLTERPIGGMKGILVYMSDDFNEPLEDFADYMPDDDSIQ